MNDFICKIATPEELEQRWEYQVSIHKRKAKWNAFKDQAVKNCQAGRQFMYIGKLDGEIITEATVSIDPSIVQNSDGVVLPGTVYMSAVRTNTDREGQGYMSKLMKFIDYDLKKRGVRAITIGAEKDDARCISIYNHLGFNEFIKSGCEIYPPDKMGDPPKTIEVNYYLKNLK